MPDPKENCKNVMDAYQAIEKERRQKQKIEDIYQAVMTSNEEPDESPDDDGES